MRKTAANDDVMTTREAGERLGVAVRTVQLWVEAGVLPAWRTAGGHRRIARSAVERLLSERKHDLANEQSSVSRETRALRLLLVDDDGGLAARFSEVANQWNFPVDVSTAGNGFEGLIRLGELHPDVVITDLVMTGMNGFEMLKALRKPGSGAGAIKVVVLSILSAAEIAERGGLPEGIQSFQKPVDFSMLETLLRKYYVDKMQQSVSVM